MKVYLLDDFETARQIKQLFALRADCLSLRWNRIFVRKPAEVLKSLDILEDYIENCVEKYCRNDNLLDEMDDSEWDDIYHEISEKSETLKRILGSGVVLSSEKDKVVSELDKYPKAKKLVSALKEGKNIVII